MFNYTEALDMHDIKLKSQFKKSRGLRTILQRKPSVTRCLLLLLPDHLLWILKSGPGRKYVDERECKFISPVCWRRKVLIIHSVMLKQESSSYGKPTVCMRQHKHNHWHQTTESKFRDDLKR